MTASPPPRSSRSKPDSSAPRATPAPAGGTVAEAKPRKPAPASSTAARRSKRRVGERRELDRRLSVQTSDESIAARFRARQYVAVMRALPLASTAALVQAVIVGAQSPLAGDGPALLVWLALVVAMTMGQLQLWRRWRQATAMERVDKRRLNRVAIYCATYGAVWTAWPAWLLVHGTAGVGSTASLVGACLTGMLCVGALTLTSMPRAAYAYLGAMGGVLLLTLLTAPGMLLIWSVLQWATLIAMACTVVAAVSRTLQARVSAEVRSEHQGQLIGLLLRDFEEQGSDVIWEIDERGRLRNVSKALAEALGRDAELLTGRSLLTLLGELQKTLSEADRDSAHTLHERLTEGQPFRDVLLPMMVDGRQLWWAMTAKPLVDDRGAAMGWRGVARDVTQARVADRRLAWLAHYDTLTSLTNRAHFRVLLEQALQQSKKLKLEGAVMCLDLDGFKTVNDTLGHATGDALLVEVGRRLKSACVKGDVVARLGGDEFAVLVRQTPGHFIGEAEITAAAQRVIDSLREPCEALGAVVSVRASIGIARFPQDGGTVDEMMQHADLALYDAKATATGSMRFFVQHMGEQVRRRLVLERDLREAMEHGQLHLHYQPKVDLSTWEITGFEALLRWQHPEHGSIPPSEFIPVAEDSGLILPMGEWALTEACREAARWPARMQVAVNISPVQVMAQNLPEAVQRALDESGLEPHRLELEITESVFINETRGTVGRLHALRTLGIQIALDDFGTGYSSLAYLRRFPFDTLKIDRAFVRELLTSRDARAIVRNILALAKSLRMATVAEGVEEPAQVNVLASEGCDLVQGYYVSRPMPADEVMPFVRQWTKRDRPVMPRDFELANTQTADLSSRPLTLQ